MNYVYTVNKVPDVWEGKVSLDLAHNIKERWDELHNSSKIFRYKIEKTKEKVLDGNFLLQLNLDRGIKRRFPEQFDNIRQAFNPNLFNFTKVSNDEVIIHVDDENGTYKHSILVNVSPISRYHSLICPAISQCLPQIVTKDSLRLVLEIMFLCQDRDMRIGFNSMCALASVNHLHYHILIEPATLPVEKVKCKNLIGQIYYFEESYPVPGFCMEIRESLQIENICTHVFRLVEYFLNENIAHNMLITRGDSLKDDNLETLRIVLWPRKSCYGVKQLQAFNVAVCELSGWFPIYKEDDFERLTKSDLESELCRWKLDNLEELCEKIKILFTE